MPSGELKRIRAGLGEGWRREGVLAATTSRAASGAVTENSWRISGRPPAELDSQRSRPTERQPLRSKRSYISTEAEERIWSPWRYCEIWRDAVRCGEMWRAAVR